MAITFRHYNTDERFGEDYAQVRGFLLEMGTTGFSYGRWDWMVTHGMLDAEALPRIGLWQEGDSLVALTSFDTRPGQGHFCIRPGYEALAGEVFRYAQNNFARDGAYQAIIADTDRGMQAVAAAEGFAATSDREEDAVYTLKRTAYALPEGFSITSMADRFDLVQYRQVLYKGFNHEAKEGPFAPTEAEIGMARFEMLRPNVDLSLKIAVVAPNGDFVSYCGMWYDPAVDFAIVEPVATDPAYRRRGLGGAAVLEGIRRCHALGAKRAFVGSSQQFYYSIGFRPYATSTAWEKQK